MSQLQNVPATKCSKFKTPQVQTFPASKLPKPQNVPNSKCPKPQNVPSLKMSKSRTSQIPWIMRKYFSIMATGDLLVKNRTTTIREFLVNESRIS